MIAIYDAVVLGAGPAGSSLARTLARGGFRVLLADKEIPGQGRVCGGFLGSEVHAVWEKLGLEEDFSLFPKRRVDSLLISGGSGKALSASFPSGHGYAVDREKFDAWLFDQASRAGAEVSPKTRLVESRYSQGLWFLRLEGPEGLLEIGTRHLIGAAGRRPPVNGKTGQNIFFACKTTYENVSDLDGRVALHFVPKGHVGLNPLGGRRATMCLYVAGSYLREAKGDLDLMMGCFMRKNPWIQKHLSDARRVADWRSCPAEPDTRKVFFKDRTFFAGDAVTMVNPIIGGGIPVAMECGVLLGECLVAARRRRRADAWTARLYSRRWNALFGRRVRYAAWLGRIERIPFLTDQVFGLIERFPFLLKSAVKYSRPTVIEPAGVSATV